VNVRAAIEEVTPDESLLMKQSSVMSADDRDLLACYHHGFDDEKVDIDLIICLLYSIHSQSREGQFSAVFSALVVLICFSPLYTDDFVHMHLIQVTGPVVAKFLDCLLW